MPFFQLLLIRGDAWQQGQSSFAWQVVTVWLHVFFKEGMIMTHEISVGLSEDIWPFLGGIFSTHLSLWALFLPAQLPTRLRAVWPKRQLIGIFLLTDFSLELDCIDSVSQSAPCTSHFQGSPKCWLTLGSQALAYFSASPASSSLPFLQLLSIVCVPPLKKKT